MYAGEGCDHRCASNSSLNLQFASEVRFKAFTLGKQPVVLGPIQVSRMPRGSVRIRVLLDYKSDMHVELDLDSRLLKLCETI